MIILADAFD